jgi:histone H3/H4
VNRLTVIFVLLLPLSCLADSVVPIDEVENNVNIRLSPDAASEIVGRLDQGSSTELVRSFEGWHEVQLEGDATGYISADWTRVVSDEPVEDKVVEVVAEEVGEEGVEEVAEDVMEEVAEEVVEEVAEEAAEEVVAEPVVEEVIEVVVEEIVVEEIVEPAPKVVVEQVEGPISELKGARNFLVKFRDTTEGGNSQIYDDGNQVGIGTTEPKQRLEVNGSIQIHARNSSVAGLMITQSSGDTGYIMHNRASTLTIGAGSQDRITIDRDGNVGIAVSRPDHPLEMANGAYVSAGGVWTNSSSRDKKENIATLPADTATFALMALEPVVFNYRNETGEEYVGFIAEDVPELVATGARDALSTMDIVAVLTRVVQEQENKIKELEARLDAL